CIYAIGRHETSSLTLSKSPLKIWREEPGICSCPLRLFPPLQTPFVFGEGVRGGGSGEALQRRARNVRVVLCPRVPEAPFQGRGNAPLKIWREEPGSCSCPLRLCPPLQTLFVFGEGVRG